MKSKISFAIVLAAVLWTGHAHAQNVEVKDPWARATVQGQKASGAFMTLTAKTDTTLVGVASSVAGMAEVHEMKMDGNTMQMRALSEGLRLPAGKAVALKPGSFHLMLMELKLPLQKDTTIPVTLRFKDARGVESTLDLKVPVATSAPSGDTGVHQHGMHDAPAKP
ncbi:MAG: copper chaperone PCu(A)C [Betaproteobacteria bacterium]